MEFCMDARALRSRLRRELATRQASPDAQRSVAGFVSVPAEDFSVDDLLDLSSGEFEDEDKGLVSLSSLEPIDDEVTSNVSNFSAAGESDSFLSGEQAIPEDEIAAGLEWVSQFVDETLPESSLLYPAAAGYGVYTAQNRQTEQSESCSRPSSLKFMGFSLPVPVKSRSKRHRSIGQIWSLGTNSTSPTSSCAWGFSSSTSCLTSIESIYEPPVKRRKKNPTLQDGERRCSHCLVQKTPQWRTGPEGPKTLCNACGVRFKSGRLLPEYRPAYSPTFSWEVHSNSHRKVMEMRRRKEAVEPETRMITRF